MNCKRARLHIALDVGDDLDSSAAAELERHLAECAECRDYRRCAAGTLDSLHDETAEAPGELQDSLWPDLLEKLPPRPGRVPDFNGWWVALAVSAACVAILMFWQEETDRSLVAGTQAVPAPAAEIPGNLRVPAKPVPDVTAGLDAEREEETVRSPVSTEILQLLMLGDEVDWRSYRQRSLRPGLNRVAYPHPSR